MSIPMRQLSKDMIHHMQISFATMRQPILTRQYMALAAFPGFYTSKSLFYAHEFWYRDEPLRPYFEKFNLVMSTDFAQVVLAPLFGVHACFHLQMLDAYVMPSSGSNINRQADFWPIKTGNIHQFASLPIVESLTETKFGRRRSKFCICIRKWCGLSMLNHMLLDYGLDRNTKTHTTRRKWISCTRRVPRSPARQ